MSDYNDYNKIASFYMMHKWRTKYLNDIKKHLLKILNNFNIYPKKLLDLACGDGTFAIEMEKTGLEVTGIDLSLRMIELAKKKSLEENVKITFLQQNMINLSLEDNYDLITCWGNSLNHILDLNSLEKVFSNIESILKKNGYFIFDFLTILRLIDVSSRRNRISANTSNLMEIQELDYDFEKNIITIKNTTFVKEDNYWKQIKSIVKERGYFIEEIKKCIKKSGLQEIICYGNLEQLTQPEKNSQSLWFITKKK